MVVSVQSIEHKRSCICKTHVIDFLELHAKSLKWLRQFARPKTQWRVTLRHQALRFHAPKLKDYCLIAQGSKANFLSPIGPKIIEQLRFFSKKSLSEWYTPSNFEVVDKPGRSPTGGRHIKKWGFHLHGHARATRISMFVKIGLIERGPELCTAHGFHTWMSL